MKEAIVVTGFGPFGPHSVNASWVAVQALRELWDSVDNSSEVELIIEEIPVCYEYVQDKATPFRWCCGQEDIRILAVIHVGVSSQTCEIKLEELANNDGYNRGDILNKVPTANKCIINTDKPSLCTKFDTKQLVKNIQDSGSSVKVSRSENAGRYLCEFIFYKSLNCTDGYSLFVHVPPLDQPYSKEDLAETLFLISKGVISQIKGGCMALK